MTIKSDAEKYFRDSPQERGVALKLDEAFDITFRDSRSGFSFWLADPKQQTRERFGLEQ